MAATLGVRIVGDAVGLKTALAEATAATERYAATSKAAFAGISDASLQAQLAQYKLGKAAERYGEGSVGAAQATLAYRRQVEALRESHLRTAQSIGRGLTTYVTAPTSLLGFEAVKMGIEFQRQMLLIQTQAGASAAEVRNLTGEVLKLAPAVGMGPTQLAQGLYHLESLGLRGQKAMQTLRISSIAAGMGIANLEDVTTALGGAVVTGIGGAQNYRKAMATLVATVGAGNMRFEDLAGSIGNVAPAAAAAGVTLPELGAAYAVLTDRGLSADEAATRLRMTFALLQAPTAKAKKALKDMGIDADSLAATLRSPGGLGKVLAELHDSIQRLGAARGNKDLIQAFGGGRSSLGIQILVQSLTNSLSGYQRKLVDVSAGEQKYARNQKAYMDSAAFKLNQDWAEARARLTQFGADIAPVAVKAVQAVGVMGDAFAKLPRGVQTAVGGVIGLFALGGPLILALVGARRMVSTLAGAFRLLPLEAGPAVAATDAEIATLGNTSLVAESRIASLRGALLGLSRLGVIAVGVEVQLHRKQVANAIGNEVTKITGSEGLGHAVSKFEHAAIDFTAPGLGGFDIAKALFGGKSNAVPGKPVSPTAKTLFGPGGSLNSLTNLQHPAHLKPSKRKTTPEPVVPATASPPPAGQSTPKPAVDPGFLLPFPLQLEQARAQLTKGTADDKKALRDIIANAKQQIASGRLSHPDVLQAINAESTALQQLWSFEASATKKHTAALRQAKKASEKASQLVKTSSMEFVKGIGFASEADKKAAEARFAQIQAHNGHIPSGSAAFGLVVNINGSDKSLDAIAREVIKHVQKAQKRGPRQTRGRHGGNTLAVG